MSRIFHPLQHCATVSVSRSFHPCILGHFGAVSFPVVSCLAFSASPFSRLLCWHSLHIFSGALVPDRILPGAKFTLRPSLAFSYIGSVTALHSSSGRQPNFVAWYTVQGMELRNFRRGRHLYSAGRPSRWASAHILVFNKVQGHSAVICAKTAEPIDMQFRLWFRMGHRNHVVDVGPELLRDVAMATSCGHNFRDVKFVFFKHSKFICKY